MVRISSVSHIQLWIYIYIYVYWAGDNFEGVSASDMYVTKKQITIDWYPILYFQSTLTHDDKNWENKNKLAERYRSHHHLRPTSICIFIRFPKSTMNLQRNRTIDSFSCFHFHMSLLQPFLIPIILVFCIKCYRVRQYGTFRCRCFRENM